MRRVRPEITYKYNPHSANFTLEQLAEAGEDLTARPRIHYNLFYSVELEAVPPLSCSQSTAGDGINRYDCSVF